MKPIFFLIAIALLACNSQEQQNETTANHDTAEVPSKPPQQIAIEKPATPLPDAKIYSNERFKEVTVEKIGEHTFMVKGKGQMFEASFGWVVEDGHNELRKGFETTDAGAPEWGNFSFTVEVQKERANSTMMLILFASSPKDGSRQYELPVLLPEG